jgi:hypothetical protein
VNEGLEESHSAQPGLDGRSEADRNTPLEILTSRGRLRLAYTLEFLLAILTVFTVWSEVGGQGHLDLLPWYVKLIGVLGCSWCCIRFTAAIVEQTAVWNRRSIGWLAGILIFVIAMGGITYYYHLNEEQNDDGDETSATASLSPCSSALQVESTKVTATFSGHGKGRPMSCVLFLFFK